MDHGAMGESGRPVLSVIIASFNSRETIAGALRSLAGQRGSGAVEVIVVDSSTDDTAALVAEEFPQVRLIRSTTRRYPGDARNLGVAQARGDVLALLDADCVVGPDWAERVLTAHEAPHPVIGGVVENGNPESRVGWSYYFTEFNHWLPGEPAGPVDDVPGCSMTLKRWAYDRYGPFLAGAYCSDTQFIWRLAADGARPYLDPAIRVSHRNPTRLARVLGHEPQHGRDFARLRSRERLTRMGALARAAASPLLPPLLFWRAARRAMRSPGQLGPFVAVAPLTLLGMTAWSWGELQGYLERALGRNEGAP